MSRISRIVTVSPPLPRRCELSLRPVSNSSCCLHRTLNGLTTGLLIFTRLAQRSLTSQPGNLLISPELTFPVGFSMSIALHAATQPRRLLARSPCRLPAQPGPSPPTEVSHPRIFSKGWICILASRSAIVGACPFWPHATAIHF